MARKATKAVHPRPTPADGLTPADYALLATWLQFTEPQWSNPVYASREHMRGLMLRLMVLARPAESGGTNTRADPRKGRQSP